nr:phage terminase small subunit-related protein [[Eubacterium] tenue]
MARARNPNRDKALEIYIQNKGNIKISKLAELLNENPKTISSWKSKDNWKEKLPRVGAPKGNKNAKGSKGNKNAKGAPKGNLNNYKHGRYMSNERVLATVKDTLNKRMSLTFEKTKEDSNLERLSRHIIYLDVKLTEAYNYMDPTDGEALAYISKLNDSLVKAIKEYERWELNVEEQTARIKKINQDIAYSKARTSIEKAKLTNNEKSKEDKIDEYFAKLEEGITNAK